MRSRNTAVALGLTVFAGGCALVPLWYSRKMKAMDRNLQQKKDALAGSQVIRGAYLNTGSKDAGADPDWDFETGRWKGRRTNNNFVAPEARKDDGGED